MDAIAISRTLVVPRITPEPDACCLCGVPLGDTDTGLLCLVCQGEEDAKRRDYQAERELTCWPFLN